MKKMTYILLTLLVLTQNVMASPNLVNNPVQFARRENVIKKYILDLQKADYQDITSLFVDTGTVISTSKGNMTARDFFAAFLPNITSATTQVHQTFASNEDRNHFSARFHFTYTLNDGEKGDGEYVDEFIFVNNSSKLSKVYMFENLKFNP